MGGVTVAEVAEMLMYSEPQLGGVYLLRTFPPPGAVTSQALLATEKLSQHSCVSPTGTGFILHYTEDWLMMADCKVEERDRL